MYKELVEGGLSNRGRIVSSSEIKVFPSNAERYCSLFTFEAHAVEYVKLNKTIRGFNGNYHAEALWFDVDNENLDTALVSTVELIKRLNTAYNVTPADLFIYFSGAKGFHVALVGKLFGDFGGSPQMASLHKALALRFAGNVKVDTAIYDNHRIFRIANSVNAKTGLYKVEITFDELVNGIEYVKALAKEPRTLQRTKTLNDIRANPLLRSEWENVQRNAGERVQVAANDNGFFSPPPKGERSNTLFKQAAMLFDKSELSDNAVYDILTSINNASPVPMETDELRDIVKSARIKTAGNKKHKREDPLIVKTLGDLLPEWEEEMFSDKGTMTTGFPSLDKDLNHRLRGKVGAIMGYGGTKKSLYALNVGIMNACNEANPNDGVCLYSSMEMNAAQNVSRVIDIMVEDTEHNFNSSYMLQRIGRENREEARHILYNSIKPLVGNRLQFILNSRMTAEKYDKVIERMANEGQIVSQLIVDGLSMMGGSGREVEDYSINSSELKDLANKWNIFIPLICHLSKGAELHTRDTRRNVRGSEKILDNCDFLIMLSLLVDNTKVGETTEYLKTKGYLRFYNKRGSGNTIDRIYNFNTNRLTFTESDEDPRYYESKSQGIEL